MRPQSLKSNIWKRIEEKTKANKYIARDPESKQTILAGKWSRTLIEYNSYSVGVTIKEDVESHIKNSSDMLRIMPIVYDGFRLTISKKRDSSTVVFLWMLRTFQEQLFYRTPLVLASDIWQGSKYISFGEICIEYFTHGYNGFDTSLRL